MPRHSMIPRHRIQRRVKRIGRRLYHSRYRPRQVYRTRKPFNETVRYPRRRYHERPYRSMRSRRLSLRVFQRGKEVKYAPKANRVLRSRMARRNLRLKPQRSRPKHRPEQPGVPHSNHYNHLDKGVDRKTFLPKPDLSKLNPVNWFKPKKEPPLEIFPPPKPPIKKPIIVTPNLPTVPPGMRPRFIEHRFRKIQHSLILWRNRVRNIQQHQETMSRASKFWKQLQLQSARYLKRLKEFEKFDDKITNTRREMVIRSNREYNYRASLNMEKDVYKEAKKLSDALLKKNQDFEATFMKNAEIYFGRKGPVPSNWVDKEVADFFYD